MTQYDVAVVGSGAGGIAAWVLVNLGLDVILLEAGRMLDPGTDFLTHTPGSSPFAGTASPASTKACGSSTSTRPTCTPTREGTPTVTDALTSNLCAVCVIPLHQLI